MVFVHNIAAGGNGELFGKALVSQGLDMPKTAVVVQQLGDEDLPPGTVPFTRCPWCPSQEMCLRLQEGPDSHVCHEIQ